MSIRFMIVIIMIMFAIRSVNVWFLVLETTDFEAYAESMFAISVVNMLAVFFVVIVFALGTVDMRIFVMIMIVLAIGSMSMITFVLMLVTAIRSVFVFRHFLSSKIMQPDCAMT